jgi:glycine/D-amino acid oxidase-like deaminating enzyme
MDLRTGTPFWRTIETQPIEAHPLEGEIDCEVAVIGGGITGALVSHALIRAGVDVVVVDSRELGTGSTAASTGLLQYEIDVPLVDLIQDVGEAHAVHAYRRGLRAIDEIEQLVETLGDDCGFARRSTLYFASRPEDAADLKREFECRQYFDFEVQFWNAERIRAQTSINAPAAIYSAGDGQIDPLRFTRALLEKSQVEGLRIFSKTCVRQTDRLPARFVLTCERGQINARSIVYAAGYEAGHFLPHPIGSLHSTYAVASEPLADSAGWPDGCLLWETARPYFYARQTADGRAIIGGEDTEYSDDHTHETLVHGKAERLLRRFASLFPSIDFVPACAWAGTFGETQDGLAYIGAFPGRDGEFFAMGYGGNGITFSQIAGRLIVDLFLGRPNDDAAVFRFGR